MNIISQIFKISTKNSLLNVFSNKVRDSLNKFIEFYNDDYNSNKYLNMMLSLQELSNKFILDFLSNYIEAIDNDFKNSDIRKKQYYINKSNISRTIITIFGELNYKRTLYIDKITGEYYNYIDDILNIDSYKNYDCLVRAILINDACLNNPNYISKHSSLNSLNLKNYLKNNLAIPRSTIYNFKKEVKIRKVNYDLMPTNKSLYVMVDEKWIHKQDKKEPNVKKWIMSKCFVTFTGIERKGKRSRLIGKHIFITSSNSPWKEFANEIYNIYDFEKIETINLLSDAGSWILSGRDEIKFFTNNKIIVNTCEFHVKQKINRSTTDKELRIEIANIIYESEDKQQFIKKMNEIINSKTSDSRKQKVTEYKNYILKHWKGIINMKYSLCKSSMEAHIEHCIASYFSSVPKAFSNNNIETYLKINEMILNGIDIMKYYLETYNSDEKYVYKEKEVNFSLFETSSSNIPLRSSSSPISYALYGLAHPSY